MAKFIPDSILELPLAHVRDNATRAVACAGQPASYAEANAALGTGAGKALGAVEVGSADFSITDGTVSGRKLVVGEVAGGAVAASGTADHWAYVDDDAGALLAVTTTDEQALTAGNPLDLLAGDVLEVRDPS